MGQVSPSGYDIQINGYNFRILRDDEQVGYNHGLDRQEVEDPTLRPSTRLAFSSRTDSPGFYQTSWAGGQTWWEPLYSPDNANTYSASANFDAYTRPGAIVPTNTRDAVPQALFDNSPLFAVTDSVYGIGSTQTTDSTAYDVYKWTPASDDFVRVTDYTSAITSTNDVFGIAYRPSDGYVYVMGDTKIGRFNPVSTAQNNDWVTVTSKPGDTLMLTADGAIWVYDDGLLKELNTSGPSLTTRKDDGFGADIVNSMAQPASPLFEPSDLRLATAGWGGVHYVKNTYSNGLPQALLSRVDRDQAGAYIRYGLSSLPPGTLALNIAEHLGSIIIAATPDWQLALQNDASATERPRIDFYSWTEGSGLAPIGSIDRDEPTDAPTRFMGTVGNQIVIGSDDIVYVYDPRNGGVHPWLDLTDTSSGTFKSVTTVLNSSSQQQLLIKEDASSSVMNLLTDNPTTVVDFGDDLTTYTLTSNYIDFNRPFEDKTITAIHVQTETLDTNQRYYVQISVDDGTFTTRATHTNATYSTTDVSDLALTGKRFRYRIIYETRTASAKAFRAVELEAASGEIVPFLELRLLGQDVRNIENEVVSPQEVYDELWESGELQAPVKVIDYWNNDAEYRMKIQGLQIRKNASDELMAFIRLVGV